MTKQKKINIVLALFLAVGIIDVWAVITTNKFIETIFKPLIIITLTSYYLVSVKKPIFWFLLGLFFSFLGDIFLLFKEEFFTFGLGAFLIVHCMYIKTITGFLNKITGKEILKSAIPFIFLFIGLLSVIKDNLGEMFIPVIVYGLVISIFGTLTLLNYRNKKSTENLWLLIGASLFIVSDSIIAINNFYSPNHLFDLLIIVFYIIAQYLICKAMILI